MCPGVAGAVVFFGGLALVSGYDHNRLDHLKYICLF